MRISLSLVSVGLAALLVSLAFLSAGCPTGTGDTGGGLPGGLFNLPPTVVLTADVDRGVTPLTVHMNSSGSTDDGVIIGRNWDFGDGTSSAEISPTHIYEATGTYTVTLTLTDDEGAQSSKTTEIIVTERPVAVISVDTTTADEAPATFTFDGSASYDPDAADGDDLDLAWDFDDGSRETEAIVDHTFARAGTYRVTLTVTDATGITGTATRIVQIGIPAPTITFLSPPSDVQNIVCSPSSPLWLHVTYDVEPGTARFLTAGIDRDLDACDAVAAAFEIATAEAAFDLDGHTGPVRAAAFSPDGTLAVTTSDDGTARLYDTTAGAFLRNFAGGYGTINDVAFSPDGTRFVIGAADGTVAIVETTSGALVQAGFVGHADSINAVAWSPTGDQILSGDDGGIAILWDVASVSEVRRFTHDQGGTPQAVYDVAFWPTDVQSIVTGSADATARVWSTADGSVTQTFAPTYTDGNLTSGHADAVRAVAVTGDGLQLATGSDDGTAKVWNVLATAEQYTLEHPDAVRSVAYSANSMSLATGGATGGLRVYDMATGELSQTYAPCSSPIEAVAFAPDGTLLLAAIAAQNAIQLDTDPPQGNDMNLTVPTALDLTDVPTGEYFLYAEIDTDQTEAERVYAAARVNVINSFGTTTGTAPVVPLGDSDEAYVIVPAKRRPPARNVFDIGALEAGDRLHVSLLTTPGYGDRVAAVDGYSVLILDGLERLFSWQQDGFAPLTALDKLVIGHDSPHYYFVVDSSVFSEYAPNLHVRVERGFAADSQPREQIVYLEFGEVTGLAIADSLPFNLPDFSATYNTTVRDTIINQLQGLFAAYDITVRNSDDGLGVPTEAHKKIYFDTTGALITRGGVLEQDLLQYGLPNFSSPRNQTLSGAAIVVMPSLLVDYPAAVGDDVATGTVTGNAAGHQLGLMMGLRMDNGTGVMGLGANLSDAGLLVDVTPAPTLAGFNNISPIGTQDADQILSEVAGP